MSTVSIIFICLLFLSAFTKGDDVESRVVNTSQGPVRGYKGADGDYFAFYGIPYATAPTGIHRFKAPLPGPTWSEPFDAVDKGIICPQGIIAAIPSSSLSLQMKEDCLIANIYVPITEENNLPVLVHIHGGGYIVGFGNMIPQKVIANEGKAIVVNFNYRLGAHGFLCLGTENAPGNAGMKDMVALLRWVRENIGKFGGNPNDVTISGFSAGAAAVNLLKLSKSIRGLFHKVVPESGAAISAWSVDVDPVKSAKAYAEKLNFTSNDVYALEKYYTTLSIDVLMSKNDLHVPEQALAFAPCVERDTGVEIFLHDSPYDILKSGDFEKLPTLYGFTEMEGIFRLEKFDDWKSKMNKNFSQFLPADLSFENAEEQELVAKQVKEFYFGNKEVSEDNLQGYVNIMGDMTFAYPTVRSVKLELEAGHDSIFLYIYSFADDTSFEGPLPKTNKVLGAGHCAQTFAILFENGNYTDEYKAVKQELRKLWINFIKTGKPVPNVHSIYPEGWPPVSKSGSPYMDLGSPSKLKGVVLQERMEFWDQIYEKYYRNPIPPTIPSKST